MSSKVISIVIAIVLVVLIGAWVVTKSNVVKAPTQNMENMPANSSSASSQPVSTNSVAIQNYSFSPSTITVKAGDSVTWTNQDSVEHSATADDNSWNTGLLPQGKSGSITFSKPGTYTYHCSVHPSMHGTVIVK